MLDRNDYDEDVFKLRVLHVDMDAFYAAVEEADNPGLKGSPVIIGGRAKHGIVTTCNYEARKYGIHSAMPMFKATKKCPHGIFLRARMERYREVSRKIFDILKEFTGTIEKVSVDEAYLDMGHVKGDMKRYLSGMKDKVLAETGLTMSVGLSYNKFLAKLASDWNKPDGFKIIDYNMIPEILFDLDVKEVHGIGRKSADRLYNIGIYTVEDLLGVDEDFLVERFGKMGREVYYRIRGIDERKIDVDRERKSIGIERTFDKEIDKLETIKAYLKEFSEQLSEELFEKEIQCRTIILKIKDKDFKTQTRSRTLDHHISAFDDIHDIGLELLSEIELDKSIRLLGISGGNLLSIDLEQLSLFGD